MFKAVVFDLDGTLVDSPLCFATIRKRLGIPEGAYILEHLAVLPEETRLSKHAELEQIELEAAKRAVPFAGVTQLLRELRASGLRVGVFTRNCRIATDHIVATHDLAVELCVTRDDAPPKPDPSGLKKFLDHWEIPGKELLFVGDFRFDIECGKKAGVITALFTNGERVPGEDWKADYVIPDYSLFLQLVMPEAV